PAWFGRDSSQYTRSPLSRGSETGVLWPVTSSALIGDCHEPYGATCRFEVSAGCTGGLLAPATPSPSETRIARRDCTDPLLTPGYKDRWSDKKIPVPGQCRQSRLWPVGEGVSTAQYQPRLIASCIRTASIRAAASARLRSGSGAGGRLT